MIETIYIEDNSLQHPRVLDICARFPKARKIICCAETPDEAVHFFSGYDCDSLALEPVTDFAKEFLRVIRSLPNAWMELRTKRTQVRHLMESVPFERCIVAFSFRQTILPAR